MKFRLIVKNSITHEIVANATVYGYDIEKIIFSTVSGLPDNCILTIEKVAP